MQISTEGGTEPVWNPNGPEVFCRSGDKMMAVDIETQPSFTVSNPRALVEGRYERSPATSPYSVSPDGQRFLMLKSAEAGEAAPTHINVVLNWLEELKRRVPAAKRRRSLSVDRFPSGMTSRASYRDPVKVCPFLTGKSSRKNGFQNSSANTP